MWLIVKDVEVMRRVNTTRAPVHLVNIIFCVTRITRFTLYARRERFCFGTVLITTIRPAFRVQTHTRTNYDSLRWQNKHEPKNLFSIPKKKKTYTYQMKTQHIVVASCINTKYTRKPSSMLCKLKRQTRRLYWPSRGMVLFLYFCSYMF